MSWLWLLSCLEAGPLVAAAPELPVTTRTLAFAITARGQSIAGLGLVTAARDLPGGYELVALSPMGTSLFTVRASPAMGTEADAVSPQWATVLERLPFHRDLTLVFNHCRDGVSACHLGMGALREQGEGWWHYTGTGGGARVYRTDTEVLVEDGLRGYTLRVQEVQR